MTDGRKYVPFEQRTGNESIVYFTRDISPEGILKAYQKVNANITGKVAVKLHTGERNGPNFVPAAWVKEVMENDPVLKDAVIVETNTYYEGDRYTTEDHRKTLEVNGWNFCPVDIMDECGITMLPVKGGKWFTEMAHGSHMLNYDSLFVLTHFKGHTQGGFGGSNKNIGIGCADGRIGKGMIHGKNILLAKTPQEFADAISKLDSDPELWRKISDGGLEFLRNEYDPKHVEALMDELFASVRSANLRAADGSGLWSKSPALPKQEEIVDTED